MAEIPEPKPKWTPVKCINQNCQWRGPLGKAVSYSDGVSQCPRCASIVTTYDKETNNGKGNRASSVSASYVP